LSEFKKQVISSSKWAMLNQLVTQVIRLSVSVYMMRLLEPESFGVFMKVLAVVGISETLIGFRLGGGIIQAANISHGQLVTINRITIVGSLILAAAFVLGADYLALFYGDPRIAPITRISSIAVVFLGIGYVPFSLLNKALNFKKIFIANATGIILSSIVGIWLALHGYDYWSLVWQWVLFYSVSSLFYLINITPNLFYCKTKSDIHNIQRFSRKILYDDLLNYGVKNIDNILVGKYLGSSELGYYSRAYNLMLIPIQNFVNIIRGILFPALSKISSEKDRLKNLFFMATQTISFVLLPFFLFSLIYTDELVFYVLGVQWLPIVSILRIFLVLSMIQAHTALISSVYLSLGRSDLMFKFGYISRPLLLLLIFIVVQFGLIPLVITVAVGNILISITFLIIGLSLIETSLLQVLSKLKAIFFINGVIFGSIFLFQHYYLREMIDFYRLLFVLGVAMIFYVTFFEKTQPPFYKVLRNQLFNIG
jgi:O-antigen/teichoic acid export membrane protein